MAEGGKGFDESRILELLCNSVSDRGSAKVHESLTAIIQDEIGKALTRALQEGHFYRPLNSQVTDSIETGNLKRETLLGCSGPGSGLVRDGFREDEDEDRVPQRGQGA